MEIVNLIKSSLLFPATLRHGEATGGALEALECGGGRVGGRGAGVGRGAPVEQELAAPLRVE